MSDSQKINHGNESKDTWAELLDSTISALEAKSLPNARVEADWILEVASGYSREELIANLNVEAPRLGAKHLDKILNKSFPSSQNFISECVICVSRID